MSKFTFSEEKDTRSGFGAGDCAARRNKNAETNKTKRMDLIMTQTLVV